MFLHQLEISGQSLRVQHNGGAVGLLPGSIIKRSCCARHAQRTKTPQGLGQTMFKTILLGLIILIGAAVAAFIFIGRERSWELIAGSPDQGQRDFSINQRSATSNDALACSPGLCTEPDFEVTPFDDAPAIAIERLSQRLMASDPLARRVDDRKDPAKARFVTYSPLIRFPDMIHLEARPMPGGNTGIMAYAGAQLGKSDLGKNRARLEALLGAR